MNSSKLSTSFSAHELKNISSYRQQRMRSKPRLNHSELPEPVSSTAHKDLEHIQQCLKNNINRRRSSQGCISAFLAKDQSTVSRLRRQVEQLDSPVISDYLTDVDTIRSRPANRYTNDTSLNVIQENPSGYVQLGLFKLTKKDISGVKARINLNTVKPFTANNGKQSIKTDSMLQDLAGSKHTPMQKSTVARKTNSRHTTMGNSKVESHRGATNRDATRLMKKLEGLREEFDKAALRKHHEIGVYFDRIVDCLKDQ